MINQFLKIDNFNFKNKVVIIRLDLNSPIINNEVIFSKRIENSVKTIKELYKKNAKIVLISHQGTFQKEDCISLIKHKEYLQKHIKPKILFYKDIFNEKIRKKIQSKSYKNIIMLENLRFFEDEIDFEKEDNKVKKLLDLADYYVLDCFSVSHRESTSIKYMPKDKNTPIIAGRVMEDELSHLRIAQKTHSPHICILGGDKSDDVVNSIKLFLDNKKADKILLCGEIGELALYLLGYEIGKKANLLKKKHDAKDEDLKEKFLKILKKYKSKIEIPVDLAVFDKIRIEEKISKSKNSILDKNLCYDIGSKTINKYEEIIKKAKSIYVKGTMGNFENKNFEKGTKELLTIISKSKAYKIVGGGHSTHALKMYNVLNKFDYVSLAGGALMKFLTDENLIGIENLKESFRIIKENKEKKINDFIVIGTNYIDFKFEVNKKISNIEVGDKISLNENVKLNIGGGGINCSICLSKIGAHVSYLGKMSNEYKDFFISELTKKNIDILSNKFSKKSQAKSILMQTKDEDRIIFSFKGQNNFFDYKDFDTKRLNSNNYFFTSMRDKSFKTQIKIKKLLKKRNNNSFIGVVLNKDIILKEKNIKSFIENSNVIFLNFEEAIELTKKREIEECLKEIYGISKSIIVITDGSKGAYAYDGKEVYFQKAISPKKVKDSLGAGDCFSSTFFYFHIKKHSIKNCLLFASRNTSSFISKNGKEGLLTLNEIVKRKEI